MSGLAGGTIVNVTSGGVTNPYTVGTDTILYSSGMSISFDGITFSDEWNAGRCRYVCRQCEYRWCFGRAQCSAFGQAVNAKHGIWLNHDGAMTATFAAAYAQVVSEIGNKTRLSSTST